MVNSYIIDEIIKHTIIYAQHNIKNFYFYLENNFNYTA